MAKKQIKFKDVFSGDLFQTESGQMCRKMDHDGSYVKCRRPTLEEEEKNDSSAPIEEKRIRKMDIEQMVWL